MSSGTSGYILRRLLLLVPTIFVVLTLTFAVMHLIPGDVVIDRLNENSALTSAQIAQMRALLGVDKPVIVQYTTWLWHVLHLNPGVSLVTGRPLYPQLRSAIPVTLE